MQPRHRATLTQPLQCVSQHPVANLHLSTDVVTSNNDNEAAIPMQSGTTHTNTTTRCKTHRRNNSIIISHFLSTFLRHHFPSSPLPFIIPSLLHRFPSSPLPFFTTSLHHHFPSSPLPFVTSLPHHFPSSSPPPFSITSLLHRFPSSPLPFFTTSLPHHFRSSPLPFIITSLLHHFPSSPLAHRHQFPSSPLPIVSTSLRHHFPSSPLPFPSSPLPFVTTSLSSLTPPFIKVKSQCDVLLCHVKSHTTLHQGQVSIAHHPSSFQVSEFYLSVTRKYCFPTSSDKYN